MDRRVSREPNPHWVQGLGFRPRVCVPQIIVEAPSSISEHSSLEEYRETKKLLLHLLKF